MLRWFSWFALSAGLVLLLGVVATWLALLVRNHGAPRCVIVPAAPLRYVLVDDVDCRPTP